MALYRHKKKYRFHHFFGGGTWNMLVHINLSGDFRKLRFHFDNPKMDLNLHINARNAVDVIILFSLCEPFTYQSLDSFSFSLLL